MQQTRVLKGQTPVLFLRLGVDFVYPCQKKKNNNKKKNKNPRQNVPEGSRPQVWNFVKLQPKSLD